MLLPHKHSPPHPSPQLARPTMPHLKNQHGPSGTRGFQIEACRAPKDDPFAARKLRIYELVYVGLSPLPVRVTTRIITFLVGNLYKPSFPLLLGGGTTQGIWMFPPSFFAMTAGSWSSHDPHVGLHEPRNPTAPSELQGRLPWGINSNPGSAEQESQAVQEPQLQPSETLSTLRWFSLSSKTFQWKYASPKSNKDWD